MKTQLIMFVLGIAVGLVLCFLYHQIGADKSFVADSGKAKERLHKEIENVAVAEIQHARALDSFKARNTRLGYDLKTLRAELTSAKAKTKNLQTQVYALLDAQAINNQPGTERGETPCDSLGAFTMELIEVGSFKDSLHQSIVDNLEQQVSARDGLVSTQDSLYFRIKSSFEKVSSDQRQLISETLKLQRTCKRQRTKNRVLSAALFVVSGAAINHLIRR